MISMSSYKGKFAALKAFGAAFALFLCFTLSAIPAKPDPPRLVNDLAGLFTAQQCDELEQRLVAYNDSTSTQIVVVTVLDLEGQESSAYATEIGIEWQVGSEKFDNGIIILVKPKTETESGDVFIAVGYGLEGAIPDARAKSIIDKIMIPKFIENDYYGAVTGACEAIIKMADGEGFVAGVDSDPGEGGMSIFLSVFIIALVLYIIFGTKKKGNGPGSSSGTRGRTGTYVPPITPGGFGGSSGSSGGFGGFGGGSFGGGGAGGKW